LGTSKQEYPTKGEGLKRVEGRKGKGQCTKHTGGPREERGLHHGLKGGSNMGHIRGAFPGDGLINQGGGGRGSKKENQDHQKKAFGPSEKKTRCAVKGVDQKVRKSASDSFKGTGLSLWGVKLGQQQKSGKGVGLEGDSRNDFKERGKSFSPRRRKNGSSKLRGGDAKREV